MQKRASQLLKWGVGALLVAVCAGAVVLLVSRSGDNEPLEGETRRLAIAAAISSVGNGEITGAEQGNDGTAYEVEIIPEGSNEELEVRLDADFNVVEVVPDD